MDRHQSDVRPSVRLVGEPTPFAAELEWVRDAEGVDRWKLVLCADEPAVPPNLILAFEQPLVDTAAIWTTASGRNKMLPPDWAPQPVSARATTEAPVFAAVSPDGTNRLTCALSDALHLSRLQAAVVEESGELRCRCEIFVEPPQPSSRFEIELWIDCRELPYEHTLGHVARTWAAIPAYRPAPVPESARQAMYSTWYSFHQQLDPAAVEAECRRARDLGCEAVIIDDGWQTLDSGRGYANTGDWQPERIPDLAGHVDRLHQIGMKVLLWFSVPFVGMKSQAWDHYQDKLLYTMDERGCGVLDPRYPDVREWLIQTYESAVTDWNLDGLKLDFVDRFVSLPETPRGAGDGRDIGSVQEAVHRLLADIMARLRRIHPEILIEFRQSYVGPLMRVYGNMFRANDCPADHVRNRVSVIDVRLLCGETACHGDMLMWHPNDSAESAALQLLAVLFAVPQISMRLDRLPEAHNEMLAFWLDVWRRNRDVLLDGELNARSPELNYPLVSAKSDQKLIASAYADVVVPIVAGAPGHILLVQANSRARMVIECAGDLGERHMVVRDCRGRQVSTGRRRLGPGIHSLAVPPAGLIELTS